MQLPTSKHTFLLSKPKNFLTEASLWTPKHPGDFYIREIHFDPNWKHAPTKVLYLKRHLP